MLLGRKYAKNEQENQVLDINNNMNSRCNQLLELILRNN